MRQTDPKAVGEWLLHQRLSDKRTLSTRKMHELADTIPWDKLPEVDKGMSLGKMTAAAYIKERRELAAQGDKFSASLMDYYDKHGTFQGAPEEPSEG
jgi:hypothetical protein